MVGENSKPQIAFVASLITGPQSGVMEIVINKGSADGVQNGDQFLIFGYGDEITDPVTGENLGRLEVVKGRGKVVHAQERFSTVRSIETEPPRTIKTVKGAQFPFSSGHVIEEAIPQILPFRDVKVSDQARPI